VVTGQISKLTQVLRRHHAPQTGPASCAVRSVRSPDRRWRRPDRGLAERRL